MTDADIAAEMAGWSTRKLMTLVEIAVTILDSRKVYLHTSLWKTGEKEGEIVTKWVGVH